MQPGINNLSAQQVREYRLELRHCDCAILEWGPEEGVPILALHGWLDNAATFENLAPRLNGYRIIAPDLPGHGRSAHLSVDAEYHFLDTLLVIHELLGRMSSEQVILLGHSMGAALGALYCACFPGAISHFVSIEALGPLTTPPEQTVARLSRAIKSRFEKSGHKRAYGKVDDALKVRAQVNDLEPELLRPIVERSLEKQPDGYHWSSDSRLRRGSLSRMTRPQLDNVLAAIKAPMLLITGEQGMLSDSNEIARRLALVGRHQHSQLRGGHHVHLEQPARVAALIKEFCGTQGSA